MDIVLTTFFRTTDPYGCQFWNPYPGAVYPDDYQVYLAVAISPDQAEFDEGIVGGSVTSEFEAATIASDANIDYGQEYHNDPDQIDPGKFTDIILP